MRELFVISYISAEYVGNLSPKLLVVYFDSILNTAYVVPKSLRVVENSIGPKGLRLNDSVPVGRPLIGFEILVCEAKPRLTISDR